MAAMNSPGALSPEAQREKHLVALSSVIAAVLLTGTKLTVGLLTGSLGILAEAAHSGLDLAAAALTLFAVRFAARAADERHTYGYGKIENLSALFETLLLLGTCVWIIVEAVERLSGAKQPHVTVNVWSFLVIVLSIVVDISRSRALYKVARKYQSQALEADALHFSTDILSSTVVLTGLAGLLAARRWNIPLLEKTDAVAALGVAAISIGISYRLGKKTISDLLDRVPPGLQDEIARAAGAVPGVTRILQVRVRQSGPEVFADITVGVSQELAFEHVHEITRKVEEAVRAILSKADVVVHAEPIEPPSGDLKALVRALAAREGVVAHSIRVLDEGGGRQSLELHLEVEKSLSVAEAHARADSFEKAAHDAFPSLLRVTTHLEPAVEESKTTPTLPGDDRAIQKAVEAASKELGVRLHPHDMEVRRAGGELTVTFHCLLDPALSIEAAHDLTKKLEQSIRACVPDITRVVIHVEPREGPPTALLM
jgi:cation diffusion facilitator family transporter